MPNDLPRIVDQLDTAQFEQIARLENELLEEKDGRKVDRFVFALAAICLLDIATFRDLHLFACIIVGFFELMLILFLAERYGIDNIYTIMTNAADAIKGLRGSKEAKDYKKIQYQNSKSPPE